MNIWVVSEGIYYSDESMIIATFSTKEKATKFCRNDRFKWSTFDDSFINDEKQHYRKIRGFELDNQDKFSNWKYYKP